jgi:hypothetical protein
MIQKKKQFIEKLGLWATNFAKQVDIAFDGNKGPEIYAQVPSLTTLIASDIGLQNDHKQ